MGQIKNIKLHIVTDIKCTMEERIKFVVVGDHSSGTDTLIINFANMWSGIPQFISPVTSYLLQMEVNGRQAIIASWDTSGGFRDPFHSDYDRLRPLLYHKTDVFLV